MFLSCTASTSDTDQTQAPPTTTPMEVTSGEGKEEGSSQATQDQVLSSSSTQIKDLETALDSDSKTCDFSLTQTVQTIASSQLHQRDSETKSTSMDPCEPRELQEGQEIYIQTEGLTVQVAEPGMDRIVIVNGPDGTTMHIQTPEDVPLEAVQALLGIEASNGAKAP